MSTLIEVISEGEMRSQIDGLGAAELPSVAVKSVNTERATALRDPLYLFACHLEWRNRRDVKAYEELVAALDDPNEISRSVAAHLLSRRDSPCPEQRERQAPSKLRSE